jgi:putative transposase
MATLAVCVDLFRCESATLRTHWVLVVMDQCTRRIIGFGVHAGTVDGVALCQGIQLRHSRAMRDAETPQFRQRSTLQVPPVASQSADTRGRVSRHPSTRYLDHSLFWATVDLENKLLEFRTYFNNHRTHNSLEGRTPNTPVSQPVANLHSFRWQPHCRALYQTPMAA